MARYLAVTNDLARRVATGALAPGDALPSVRELALAQGTTTSTVGRAYRRLAEAGILTRGDRRRARVAPDAAIAARALLAADPVFRLAGSDDPALELVLRRAGRTVTTVDARGSFRGLVAVRRGEADGAAIHLLHRTGTYNAPFARSLLRGRGPHLIHLWRREQGFLVPPGNPHGVTTTYDLRSLRVARREIGAGTRVLLERLLLEAGVAPEDVPGPTVPSHLEVALAVACGLADVGLGVRAAANALDLDFVAVTWESYQVALGEEALPAAASLVAALHDDEVRAAVDAIGGYDPTDAGRVTALS
jgi:molybdate-binding protein